MTRSSPAPPRPRPARTALFFLPYLTGERLGEHRNARAQFFGIGGGARPARTCIAPMLEGVAFAVTRHIRIMEKASGRKLERVIASGGGAKTALWLKIKASDLRNSDRRAAGARMRRHRLRRYGRHGRRPLRPERGAVAAYVRHYRRGRCRDPRWAETYPRMQPVFDQALAPQPGAI